MIKTTTIKKLILISLFVCLLPFSCSEKGETIEDGKCWTCTEREMTYNRSNKLVSDKILERMNTCNEKTMKDWDNRHNRSVEWDCVNIPDHPYRICGHKQYIYACYENYK